MSYHHDISVEMEANERQAPTSPFHDLVTGLEDTKSQENCIKSPSSTQTAAILPVSKVPSVVSRVLSSQGIPYHLHDSYYFGHLPWPRGLPISRDDLNNRTSFDQPGIIISKPAVELPDSSYPIEERIEDLHNILRYTLVNKGINPNESHGIFDILRLTMDKDGNVVEGITHFTADTAAYRPEIQRQLARCEHRRINLTAFGGTPAPEGYFEEQMESEKMLYVEGKWLRWEVVCEMLDSTEKEKEDQLRKVQTTRAQERLQKEMLERGQPQEQARRAHEEAQRALRDQDLEDDIEYSFRGFRGRRRGQRVSLCRNGLYRNAPRTGRSKAMTKSTNTSRRDKYFWEDE